MNRLASLILLFFITASLIVQAQTIGPGVDPSRGTFIKVAEDGTGYWHTNHIRIMFNSNMTGLCSFYSAFATISNYQAPAYGAVRFYLEENGNVVNERIFIVHGDIEFSTVHLFDVYVQQGDYVLGIQLLPRGTAGFIGSMILLGYSHNTDPSVTEYYHIFADSWIQGEYDVGFYAVCGSGGSDSPPTPISRTPALRILSIKTAGNKVNVTIEVSGFRPNSDVHIYYADLWGAIQGAELVDRYKVATITVDSNGSYVGSIYLDAVSEEDWLEAHGYDVNGNFVVVRGVRFNTTLKPGDWVSVAVQVFQALFSYLYLAYTIVINLIPYAGLLYLITLINVFFKCMNEMSLLPLFEYFYKQYQMLSVLAELMITIAEKVYHAGKTIIDWIIEIIDVIL